MKFTAIVFSPTVLKTSKLLLQLMLLLGHGESWGRRTTKRTRNSDNSISTSYTTSSSETYFAVSAFKDVQSDNLELDGRFFIILTRAVCNNVLWKFYLHGIKFPITARK